jgi:hypothetical protein
MMTLVSTKTGSPAIVAVEVGPTQTATDPPSSAVEDGRLELRWRGPKADLARTPR